MRIVYFSRPTVGKEFKGWKVTVSQGSSGRWVASAVRRRDEYRVYSIKEEAIEREDAIRLLVSRLGNLPLRKV